MTCRLKTIRLENIHPLSFPACDALGDHKRARLSVCVAGGAARSSPWHPAVVAPFTKKKQHTGNILLQSDKTFIGTLMKDSLQIHSANASSVSDVHTSNSQFRVSTPNCKTKPAPNLLILNDVETSSISRKVCVCVCEFFGSLCLSLWRFSVLLCLSEFLVSFLFFCCTAPQHKLLISLYHDFCLTS